MEGNHLERIKQCWILKFITTTACRHFLMYGSSNAISWTARIWRQHFNYHDIIHILWRNSATTSSEHSRLLPMNRALILHKCVVFCLIKSKRSVGHTRSYLSQGSPLMRGLQLHCPDDLSHVWSWDPPTSHSQAAHIIVSVINNSSIR